MPHDTPTANAAADSAAAPKPETMRERAFWGLAFGSLSVWGSLTSLLGLHKGTIAFGALLGLYVVGFSMHILLTTKPGE